MRNPRGHGFLCGAIVAEFAYLVEHCDSSMFAACWTFRAISLYLLFVLLPLGVFDADTEFAIRARQNRLPVNRFG